MVRVFGATIAIVFVLSLGGCRDSEPKAQFVNGCALSIVAYASPTAGGSSDTVNGEVFLDDGSARVLEPGEAIEFYDSQSPRRFFAVVYEGRDFVVYRWSLEETSDGLFTLEGENCPSI